MLDVAPQKMPCVPDAVGGSKNPGGRAVNRLAGCRVQCVEKRREKAVCIRAGEDGVGKRTEGR